MASGTAIGDGSTKTAVCLDKVTLRRASQRLLSEICLNLPVGSWTAILGPNGSGKSALVALLAGFLWPSEGTVEVLGRPFGRVHLGRLRNDIGLIEPSRAPGFPFHANVRDVIGTGLFGTMQPPIGVSLTSTQEERVTTELEGMGLGPVQDRAFRILSSGEQMKTLLARALIGDARLLLLDEPTVGLDPGARAACMAALNHLRERSGRPTLVIVTHHLDELPQTVDHVVLLKEGRVLDQGKPETMITSGTLSQLYDCNITVVAKAGRFMAGVSAGKGQRNGCD